MRILVCIVLSLLVVVGAQDYYYDDEQYEDDYEEPPPFVCPERNGFFPHPRKCDVYYECINNEFQSKQCSDGLLFEAKDTTRELCDYPFNVDCGNREYISLPEKGLKDECPRANGFFNHKDEETCNKYYNCVHGTPHVYTCPAPLIFDVAQGTCVREAQASEIARKCKKQEVKQEVGGFSCPEGKTLGPNNLTLAHPSFAYPNDCRKYIICLNSKVPQEAGCFESMVYDSNIMKCVTPEEFPACGCYYDCLNDPDCPSSCYDCSCGLFD